MEAELKKKILRQLKQAQGMVNKVITMIETDQYCIDILQQNLAAIGFLKSTNKLITSNHLNSCFKNGMASKDNKKQKQLIDELMHIIEKS